jgi:K+-sensing histidine kinase KdpD
VVFRISAEFIKRFWTAQYALAVLAVAAATGVRLAFDPVLGTYSPYLPFVAALLVARRTGGRGPAMAATAMSCVTTWLLFLEPRYSFVPPDLNGAVGLALFAGIGIAISLMGTFGGSISSRVATERLARDGGDRLSASLRPIARVAGAALAIGVLASFLWSGFNVPRKLKPG